MTAPRRSLLLTALLLSVSAQPLDRVPLPSVRLRGFVVLFFHVPKTGGSFLVDVFARAKSTRWGSIRTREASLLLLNHTMRPDPGSHGYGPAFLEARGVSRPRLNGQL